MLAPMRPEILFPLFAPITSLKGVGARVAPLLEKVAGPIVRDVLFLQPHSLIHRHWATTSTAVEDEIQLIRVTIDAHQKPAKVGWPWRIRCFDEHGFVTLAFFKTHGAHLEDKHPKGAERIVGGKVERFGSELRMVHPDLWTVEKADEAPLVEPVYPATANLPARTVRRLALDALARAPDLPEWQDPAWLARERFPTWAEAVATLHAPTSDADLAPQARHRRRLAFDELLAHQLAMAQRKQARRAEPAEPIPAGLTARSLEAALPYTLTSAQTRTLAEIGGDLASGERMTRLVQGDVGSGKTVVAMLAMADVADAGGQSALMAPTEILARQHFETLAGPLRAQGIEAVIAAPAARKSCGPWLPARRRWLSARMRYSRTMSPSTPCAWR